MTGSMDLESGSTLSSGGSKETGPIGDHGLDRRKRNASGPKASSEPSTTRLPSIADSSTDTFLKRFRIVEKIGEGSYSEVIKCKNKETGMFVACKRLKHAYKSWNQVNDIAEVITLRTLTRHPHILQMLEIHYDVRLGKVSLVFEVMEMNLYELIKDRKNLLAENTVRILMYQLMKALRHMHKFGVFHRDVKPENILIRTETNVLKLGDLGSVRGVYSQPPFTEYISTRWYRSPECLLTAGKYDFKMDIWAAGCVFYEILTLQPLFPGSSEIDQISKIHTIMGSPPQKTMQKFQKLSESDKDLSRTSNQQRRREPMLMIINEFWKHKSNRSNEWNSIVNDRGGLDRKIPAGISSGARDLIKLMLTYDSESRPSSQRVINHSYFNEVRDFKVPESDIIKSPTIAVWGDEYGRTLISHSYGHVDLKTLGDKKNSRRVKMQLTHSLKQSEEVTPVSKKSSPLLRGAKSPETPKSVAEHTQTKRVKMMSTHTQNQSVEHIIVSPTPSQRVAELRETFEKLSEKKPTKKIKMQLHLHKQPEEISTVSKNPSPLLTAHKSPETLETQEITDNKKQKRVKQFTTHLHKQFETSEEKVSRKSSPILQGAKSPATPGSIPEILSRQVKMQFERLLKQTEEPVASKKSFPFHAWDSKSPETMFDKMKRMERRDSDIMQTKLRKKSGAKSPETPRIRRVWGSNVNNNASPSQVSDLSINSTLNKSHLPFLPVLKPRPAYHSGYDEYKVVIRKPKAAKIGDTYDEIDRHRVKNTLKLCRKVKVQNPIPWKSGTKANIPKPFNPLNSESSVKISERIPTWRAPPRPQTETELPLINMSKFKVNSSY